LHIIFDALVATRLMARSNFTLDLTTRKHRLSRGARARSDCKPLRLLKFGAAATAALFVGTGAEAGSTAGTTNIGLTKVVNAADGMTINFSDTTKSGIITDEPLRRHQR
jgi:hypothetical protein